MEDRKHEVQLNQTYFIVPPAREKAVFIPVSILSRWIERLERVKSPTPFFSSLGWWLLGVGSTCAAAALTISVEPTRTIAWAIAAATTVCGIMALFFARKEEASRAEILNLVLEDVRHKGALSQDEAELRLRQRVAAYLGGYVERAIEKYEPLVSGGFEWQIQPLPDKIFIHTRRKSDGIPFSAWVDIASDWAEGSSGEYAERIAEHLSAKLRENIRQKEEARGPEVG